MSFAGWGGGRGNDRLDRPGGLHGRRYVIDTVDRRYVRRGWLTDRGGGDNIFDNLILIEFDYRCLWAIVHRAAVVSRSRQVENGGKGWWKEFFGGQNWRQRLWNVVFARILERDIRIVLLESGVSIFLSGLVGFLGLVRGLAVLPFQRLDSRDNSIRERFCYSYHCGFLLLLLMFHNY